jgi:hypothetical protein
MRIKNEPPTFGSISMVRPKKYCAVKAGSVSAYHTFSGVAAI